MSRLDLPPEQKYLSKDQFRQVCHIGTRTATRLIESGLVPSIDTHMKTSRYIIAREDVERYLEEREVFPEKYGYEYRTYGVVGKYTKAFAKRMAEIAKCSWTDEDDLLTVPEVARLIGYRTETIYRWNVRGMIHSIKVHGKIFVPKKSLIQFVSSPAFHEIEKKSEIHFDMIRRTQNE